MGASAILEFKDYLERDAFDIAANQVGNRWRVNADDTTYTANAEGIGAAKWTATKLGNERIEFSHMLLGTGGQKYMRAPFNGKVLSTTSIIDSAISVGNEVITPKINGTLVTGGIITVLFAASGAGDITAGTAVTAANTFSEGDKLEMENDGGSTLTPNATITWLCERTAP